MRELRDFRMTCPPEVLTAGPEPKSPEMARAVVSEAAAPTETHRNRHDRMIAEVAGRVSSMMGFGRLPERDSHTIGELADHFRVTLRTLRFYDQSGLLRPARDGTRRLYSRSDVHRLEIIISLRELEASLGAIKALMSRLDQLRDSETMVAAIEGQLVAIAAANHQRIEELGRLNRRIDRTISHLARRN